MFQMMKGHINEFLDLDALAQELQHVLERNGVTPSTQTLQGQACSLRYMYGIIKSQMYRGNPQKTSPLWSCSRICVWTRRSDVKG